MRLAVVGSRSWKDWIAVRKAINEIHPDAIVTGGAAGVDRMAMDVAGRDNFSLEVYYPDWKTYGRSAGAVRNRAIVNCCDKLIELSLD